LAVTTTIERSERLGCTQIAGSSPDVLPPSSSSYSTGVSLSIATVIVVGSCAPAEVGELAAEAVAAVERASRTGTASRLVRCMPPASCADPVR